MILLYAMHRYDLIFFARLLDSLSYSTVKYDFNLLVTDEIYSIPCVTAFIQRTFPRHIVLPIMPSPKSGIVNKVSTLLNLRNWVRVHIDEKDLLVLTDKSNPVSRFLLKQSSKALLVQQIEEISGDYTFDLKHTFRDAIISTLLGAYYARWYSSSSSGGFVRALKTSPFHKNVTKLYQVTDSSAPDHFYLAPFHDIHQGNKIVIFGSRFLSWPYFSSGNYEQRLSLLKQIYSFICVNFSSHRFVYLQHPAEKGDEFNLLNNIFDHRLELVVDCFSSEQYLYENRNINCTFSLGSTSSASAYDMGFPSKVFYKMLNFPPTVASTYDNIFSGLPTSFFARDINELIVPSDRVFPNSPLRGLVPFSLALEK